MSLPPPPAGTRRPPRTSGPVDPGQPIPGKKFSILGRGTSNQAQRVCIYGTGGVGKTSLAALAPNPLIIDLEDGGWRLDVPRIGRAEVPSLDDLREAMLGEHTKQFATIVVDSLTIVEQLCAKHVIATIKGPKGSTVDSLEDYGYGKGYAHLVEVFRQFLADATAIREAGRNVILVAHDATTNIPNPAGEDYLAYQPRLYTNKDQTVSLRKELKEWCDHLLFINYDMTVDKTGVARGNGSRTIYPVEQPHAMAKSRSLRDAVIYRDEADGQVWDLIFGGEK